MRTLRLIFTFLEFSNFPKIYDPIPDTNPDTKTSGKPNRYKNSVPLYFSKTLIAGAHNIKHDEVSQQRRNLSRISKHPEYRHFRKMIYF